MIFLNFETLLDILLSFHGKVYGINKNRLDAFWNFFVLFLKHKKFLRRFGMFLLQLNVYLEFVQVFITELCFWLVYNQLNLSFVIYSVICLLIHFFINFITFLKLKVSLIQSFLFLRVF